MKAKETADEAAAGAAAWAPVRRVYEQYRAQLLARATAHVRAQHSLRLTASSPLDVVKGMDWAKTHGRRGERVCDGCVFFARALEATEEVLSTIKMAEEEGR